MIKRGKTRRRGTFLAAYTAVWLLGAGTLLLIHFLYKRSFLFISDGLYQHFCAYRYVCDTLSALLGGHSGGLGAFNYSLGLGNDIITLLNSYDYTDPICWLTALLPLSYEARYTVMIFVKLYLVGLSFGLYCRESGLRNGRASALGAIAYCFSAATLCTFSRHPNFINWMYFFPMLMAGGERYWRKGRPGLLIAAVFLNAVVSYYTLFIDAVLFALYVAVRGVCLALGGEKRFGEALLECVKTAGACLAGALLAMAALLPAIHAFVNNNRVMAQSGYTASMLHFPKDYYFRTLFSMFVAYADTRFYVCLGAAAVCAPALCLLFLRRDGNADLRASLLLCGVMLCVPLAGRVLNGFSYVSNRWSFVLVFYTSVALVRLLPGLLRVRGWRCAVILAVCLGYIALFFLYCRRSGRLNGVNLGAMALLVLSLLPVALAGRLDRRRMYGLMAGLMAVNVVYQCVLAYVPWGANYFADFLPKGELVQRYEDHSSVRAAGLAEGFYRIEESEAMANLDGWNGTHGTAMWWSGLPSDTMDYYLGFDLDSAISNSSLRGFDGRTQLLETASVRFFTVPAEDRDEAPWGYVLREDASDDRYLVYENPDALPIAYVYPGCMLRSDFDGLDALTKQQALMQCAVVDEVPPGQAEIVPKQELLPLDHEILGAEGATLTEGGLRVDAPYGSIRLRAIVPENCEVYAVLRGVRAEGDVPVTIVEAQRSRDGRSVKKQARLFQTGYLWPVLRDRISFNLGSGMPGENEFSIAFEKTCGIRWDALDIVAVPMEAYEEQAKILAGTVLEDVRVGADEVEGRVSCREPGMLQFSIPGSAGWQAWVDGEPVEPVKSGVIYMALPLQPGEHQIRLRYRTPLLREGAIVSLVTLAGLTICGFHARRRRKKTQGD